MSRVGKNPVVIPSDITVKVDGSLIEVKGPKGILTKRLPPEIKLAQEGNKITFTRSSDSQFHKALHGLSRALVANMVKGVKEEFRKVLTIIGVGYKAEMTGKRLNLNVGYSHPILLLPPSGIKIEVEAGTKITVLGPDKELVGETAAKIRSLRPPEPYKGKGIRYEGERVRKKAGKAAGA